MAMAGFVKAALKVEGEPTPIEVQYNPEQWGYHLSNSWGTGGLHDADGEVTSTATVSDTISEHVFNAPGRGSMTLKLVFDTTVTGQNVTTFTAKLEKLMKVAPGKNRPPYVQFTWGRGKTSFKAVITTLDIDFTYFGQNGLPLRADVTLGMEQFIDDTLQPKTNPTSGTPVPHLVHQVQVGETLDRISAKHYHDPTKWRAIAEANGILDPMALEPGTILALPEVEGSRYGE